jgi:hypothetical protein
MSLLCSAFSTRCALSFSTEVHLHALHLQLVLALHGGEVLLPLRQFRVSAQQHGPLPPDLSVPLPGQVRSAPAQDLEASFRIRCTVNPTHRQKSKPFPTASSRSMMLRPANSSSAC